MSAHDLDDAVMQKAIAWHLRLRDADVADWEEFTGWLESDPAHNAAYEAVSARDSALGQLLEEARFPDEKPVPANDLDDVPMQNESRGWRWMALAASLALGVFIATQALLPGNDRYTITTNPGEVQSLTLADGGTVDINGGTEIVLDRGDPRFAELVSGEARFSIVHDASDPFIVTIGESRLVDVGTVFNVVREGEELRVDVAEGAVRYEGQETVDLAVGDRMLRHSDGTITLTDHPIEAMGGWVYGMLVYENAPLVQVTADIARATGIAITIDPAVGQPRFSGVLQVNGSPELVRARLEDLLGLTVENDAAGWTIHP